MTHLIPLFVFFGFIAIILIVAGIVRPKIPEYLQGLFTGAVIIICLIIFFEMGIGAVLTAVKGAFTNAFGSY